MTSTCDCVSTPSGAEPLLHHVELTEILVVQHSNWCCAMPLHRQPGSFPSFQLLFTWGGISEQPNSHSWSPKPLAFTLEQISSTFLSQESNSHA